MSMSDHDDPIAPAVRTAHEWLRAVTEAFDTYDRHYAYRLLRAWLHAVRDRLPVPSSAHFSAQLPEVFRGTFYEGWVPGHVPVPHDAASFVDQFAREADVSRAEAVQLIGILTDTLAELCSPGQIDHVLAVLPTRLRDVLQGIEPEPLWVGAAATPDPEKLLESRLQTLSEAVAVLARGLEELPGSEFDTTRRLSAAQQAHRMLLAEGLLGPGARQS
ncbi:uncharacterized protein (DUF2267 family) [Nocardia transvalensis]|uniref:Uncharacterized protein (DUF2267 family) n=1 Tax=Nocardia transvalensis TaxID=37333 RepID=A0A7W9PIE8_9NOCA|nr:DUF2267 domain-containing protein [Nocardia transvalensis]MBB5916736.1 uncharacterized protein (DUF2267 family) [Nocardia transvalensis]